MNATPKNTTPKQPRWLKGLHQAPPKNNLSQKKHVIPLNSMARKYAIYTPIPTRYANHALNQMGQFPTCSLRGNKYSMAMVKINSNTILVKPMKSCKDAEMIRAYDALLNGLKQVGIVPKKHILDNKVSRNMKNHIRDTHSFNMELVPPG